MPTAVACSSADDEIYSAPTMFSIDAQGTLIYRRVRTGVYRKSDTEDSVSRPRYSRSRTIRRRHSRSSI